MLQRSFRYTAFCPSDFPEGVVIAGINRRKGLITETDNANGYVRAIAEVPLANMFGYSTDLRSSTQGKGEFSMEYKRHSPVPSSVAAELAKEYQKKRSQKGE